MAELDTAGNLVPPYGPTRGMLQAIQLMRRTTPTRVDSNFLRANRIAPGNEYKVVGALRFLGLIDDRERPTEKSRLLKTKGTAYTLALQDIIRTAYWGLFRHLNAGEITQEDIYNYFITEEGLGAEMAAKATRFLISLCQLAEIELGPELTSPATPPPRARKGRPRGRRGAVGRPKVEPLPSPSPPLVIALTPETAEMDLERLTELLRKMRVAIKQSSLEESR